MTVNFLLRYKEDGKNWYCSGWDSLHPTNIWQELGQMDKGILMREQNMARCPTRDISLNYMHFPMYF